MSKFLIAAAAGAMLISVGAANAQSQSQPSDVQSQQNDNSKMTNGSKMNNDRAPIAGTVGSSRATEYPPEGQEGTNRPGQTAPTGNPGAAPVAR